MKKLFCGIIIGVLISGFCFASSNGLFEGYEIVKVKVAGNEINGDTPAINFNNRTMVPVRFVSEALGASVEWDEQNKTVDIASDSVIVSKYQSYKIMYQIDILRYLIYIEDRIDLIFNLCDIQSNDYTLGRLNDIDEDYIKNQEYYLKTMKSTLDEASIDKINIIGNDLLLIKNSLSKYDYDAAHSQALITKSNLNKILMDCDENMVDICNFLYEGINNSN